MPVAVGDQAARQPWVTTDDLDRKVRQAGACADHVGGIDARRIDVAGQLGRHEEPQPIHIHRAKQGGHVRVDQPVHDRLTVQVAPGQVGRAEDDAVIPEHGAVVARHVRTDGVPHRAAGAIRAHQVGAAHGGDRTRPQVLQLDVNAVRILLEARHPGFEADLHTGQRGRPGAQHLLKRVLRDPLGLLGIQLAADPPSIECVLEPCERRAAHPGGEYDIRRVVRRDRGRLTQRVGNAPTAQVLAGAHVGRLGTRTVGRRGRSAPRPGR